MNYLYAILFFCLAGCGGGGGSSEALPEPPASKISNLYTFNVSIDGDTRSYAGAGVEINDIIYLYPTALSSSNFTVTGEVVGDEVRLFNFVTGELSAKFKKGDSSGLKLTLTREGVYQPLSLSSFAGVWDELGGAFNETLFTLTNDNGNIAGTTSTGCNLIGELFVIDGYAGVSLKLGGCEDEGEYHGALTVKNRNISGSIMGANKGFMINQRIR